MERKREIFLTLSPMTMKKKTKSDRFRTLLRETIFNTICKPTTQMPAFSNNNDLLNNNINSIKNIAFVFCRFTHTG